MDVRCSCGRCSFCKKNKKSKTNRLKKIRRRVDPDFYRSEWAAHIKHHYGVDCEDLARMFELQGGRCAGCRSELKFDRNTHIDHCHGSGRFRGLLCVKCNMAIGLAKDSVQTLFRLSKYLEASLGRVQAELPARS